MPFPEPNAEPDESSPTIAQPVLPASDGAIDAFDRLGDQRESQPLPVAGLLVFSDELVQPVEGTVVIGREPGHDSRVAAGMALGLAIDDRALMLSRVHAEVCLLGDDVVVIDRGSINGTSIREPGCTWHALTAEVPEALVPGTEIRFGAVEATFVAAP